ncbi:DUF2515 family protein [Alkalihalobacillus sp. AL-G]|uniref:DUF2515 family protein n=1 Tax=Alkalihalobacillus sp. AL-G TaxID=2926399 RepID=UPI00272CEFFB|nr:DUF2515 family protein [Alkalihalobacillus sp. AL-G]WLD91685.1 DUF2515 domain-containing protein [Alkalihalobacillus sp. AL-G]
MKNKLDSPKHLNESHLTSDEQRLVDTINNKTNTLNLNNVTRTQSYIEFYLDHPEIQWALLGHLVSRNGGWNMTDLKGEYLSKLLSEKEQDDFFMFLERGNWLIFQDVYPQFLLYEESLKSNRPLFHLLPYLQVSAFMEPVWNYFWCFGDRYTLAIALVINEQSYLEQRVMKNKQFKSNVIESIEFSLQDLLSLNHILFPVFAMFAKTRLVGQSLHYFTSLHERILLGKRLYSVLFDDEERLRNILNWAKRNPHTGSRKDYWVHLFNDVKETLPGRLYNPQIKDCKLKQGASKIFSPQLQYAWPNVKHLSASTEDWFKDFSAADYLKTQYIHVDGEIEHAYCKSLETLSFTVFTKKAIFFRKR